MTARQMFCPLACGLLALQLAAPPAGRGDQPRAEDSSDWNTDPELRKEQHHRWIGFYRHEAASYRFYLGAHRAQEMTLQRDPVLLYTNPVGARGITHGAVFVWTLAGRSEVVGAIWSHANTPQPNQRTVSHEFHSLSAEAIIAERGGKVVWSTAPAEIPWVWPSTAPQPANSKFRRLAQMRDLARQLTVTRQDEKDGSQQQLRLLPQPVYRFERTTSPAGDGALFAYCEVWDPEVFVVIESRDTAHGPRWAYAPFRFSHLTLALHHHQEQMWRDPRGGPRHRDATMGYKLFYRTSIEGEVIESVREREQQP